MPEDPYSEFRDKPKDPYAEFRAATPHSPSMSDLMGGVAESLNPMPTLRKIGTEGVQKTLSDVAQGSADELSKANAMRKAGRYSEAFGHGLGALPLIGPAAANAAETMGGSPEMPPAQRTDFDPKNSTEATAPQPLRGIGQGLGIAAPLVLGGPLARAAGSGAEAAARPLVNTALGIPSKSYAWGASPSKFVLENTKSVRPAGIAQEAGNAVRGLNAEQEAAARAATGPAHLGPARDVVSNEIQTAKSRNSVATPRELAPMDQFLNEPQPGFGGATEPMIGPQQKGIQAPMTVAEQQSPIDLLGMRRQFNKDFIRNWNPTANTKGALGTARKVYHELGAEADRTIPGGAARDEAMSSGIAAKDAAEAASLRPSLGQRFISHISRPTKGLVPGLLGYSAGGPLGAAAGLTAAEAAASPVPLMIGARGLNLAGKGMKSPLGRGLAETGPLVKYQKERPK